MKSVYGLLAVGLFTLGLYGSACVSGDTVNGGAGGRTGGNGNGGQTGSGQGGFIGSGQGGFVSGGQGGFVGGGQGGFVGGGQGGFVGGGAGGSTTTGFMPICAPTGTVISDMEDGNFYFGTSCPKGAWHLSTAGGGTTSGALPSGDVQPIAITDRAPSTKAIHVSGAGQANVGVAPAPVTYAYVSLAASLNSPSATQKGALNGASFTGVKFWGKIAGAIELHVPNVNTDPAGHVCGVGTAGQCSDDGKVTLAPSTTWTQYTIPFATLVGSTPPFGNPPGNPFPTGQLFSIEWHVTIPTTGPAPAWDIWVDDLMFY